VIVSLRCAQGWTPAFAGDADFVRFHSGWCSINGVTLCLVPGVWVDRFEGIVCESPRLTNRDSRDEPENDSVGVGAFLEVSPRRRLGQSLARIFRVPITVSAVEDHPERCRGALHEAHENAQHRLQPELDERWVA
jgi:hypothetical protein